LPMVPAPTTPTRRISMIAFSCVRKLESLAFCVCAAMPPSESPIRRHIFQVRFSFLRFRFGEQQIHLAEASHKLKAKAESNTKQPGREEIMLRGTKAAILAAALIVGSGAAVAQNYGYDRDDYGYHRDNDRDYDGDFSRYGFRAARDFGYEDGYRVACDDL